MVSFEPDSLILSAEDVLYVLSVRGTYNVRAKSIDRLHNLLKDYIDGTRDQATLLSSVPTAQRPTIQKYLTKLHQAGALRFVEKGESGQKEVETLSQTGGLPQTRSQDSLMVAGRSVYVSLSGPLRVPARQYDACLFFITPDQTKSALLSLERWGRRGKRIVFVIAGAAEPNAIELERRKEYARWFLLNFAVLADQRVGVELYQLDQDQETLIRLLEIKGSKPSDLRSLAPQLSMVTVAEVDQVPLAVARAFHPFFLQDISMIGLRYDALYKELMLEFCTRVMLTEHTNPDRLRFYVAALGESQAHRSAQGVHLDLRGAEAWQVADSLLHLRTSLLERYADAQTKYDGFLTTEDLDLLKEDSSHPDVVYLRDVLRLRLLNLPARLLTTKTGLFIYERDGHRSCSFIRAKALRDLLLILTWHTFYSDTSAQINKFALQWDFPTFINDVRLREIVDEREADLAGRYGAANFLYRKVRCWGRTAWVGQVKGASPPEMHD